MLRACIRTPDGPKEPLINILGEVRDDGDPLYFCETESESLSELAERVLAPEEPEIDDSSEFEREWQSRLEGNLDNARLPVSRGPNWRLEVLRLKSAPRTALVCTMNHALEDQRSSNLMLREIMEGASGAVEGDHQGEAFYSQGGKLELPPSMEEAVIEGNQFRLNTLSYVLSQAMGAISQPRVVPDGLPSVDKLESEGETGTYGVARRNTSCEFSMLPGNEVAMMLQACRYVELIPRHAPDT